MLDKKSAAIVFVAMFIIVQGYNVLSYLISCIPNFLLALLFIIGIGISWFIPIIPFIGLGLFLNAIISSAIIDSRKS